MCHCGVTLLSLSPCGFADLDNVILPRQRTLSHPIAIGIGTPELTPNIMRARSHLKPVMCDEHFSRLYNMCPIYFLYIIKIDRVLHYIELDLPKCKKGTVVLSFFFFWSGLQGPKAYSLWYGVVTKPSIG